MVPALVQVVEADVCLEQPRDVVLKAVELGECVLLPADCGRQREGGSRSPLAQSAPQSRAVFGHDPLHIWLIHGTPIPKSSHRFSDRILLQ